MKIFEISLKCFILRIWPQHSHPFRHNSDNFHDNSLMTIHRARMRGGWVLWFQQAPVHFHPLREAWRSFRCWCHQNKNWFSFDIYIMYRGWNGLIWKVAAVGLITKTAVTSKAAVRTKINTLSRGTTYLLSYLLTLLNPGPYLMNDEYHITLSSMMMVMMMIIII